MKNTNYEVPHCATYTGPLMSNLNGQELTFSWWWRFR